VSALGAAIAIVATRRARSRNLTQPTPA